MPHKYNAIKEIRVELGAIGILAILSLVSLTLSAFGLKGFSEANRLRREVERLQDEIREIKKQNAPPDRESPRSWRLGEKSEKPESPRGAWRLDDPSE